MRTILLSLVATCTLAAGPARAAGPVQLGVASFNMAWAGTGEDFRTHVKVCKAVAWCDTRPKKKNSEKAPSPEAVAEARRCVAAMDKAAGGAARAMLIAPCNAYATGNPGKSETPDNYAMKLAGLQATIADLIETANVQVIAFQEVRSDVILRELLGKFAERFDTCAAQHTSFQTVAFAWDRQVSDTPGVCAPRPQLAVKEDPTRPASLRALRPGLALELVINGEKITFMNIHLKSNCANLITKAPFPGHKLTDQDGACKVLNRQIPALEDWIEEVSLASPRFMLLGDYNRRIDEEAAQSLTEAQIRSDGSAPAGPNEKDALGYVKSHYLWQEIADGTPPLHRIAPPPPSPPDPLDAVDAVDAAGTVIAVETGKAGCKGFDGLDHIVISGALQSLQGDTPISSRKVGVVNAPKQKIKTSDHCPSVVELTL